MTVKELIAKLQWLIDSGIPEDATISRLDRTDYPQDLSIRALGGGTSIAIILRGDHAIRKSAIKYKNESKGI